MKKPKKYVPHWEVGAGNTFYRTTPPDQHGAEWYEQKTNTEVLRILNAHERAKAHKKKEGRG